MLNLIKFKKPNNPWMVGLYSLAACMGTFTVVTPPHGPHDVITGLWVILSAVFAYKAWVE